MTLLTAWLAIVAEWRGVFPQARTWRRAVRQGLGLRRYGRSTHFCSPEADQVRNTIEMRVERISGRAGCTSR